MLFPLPLLFLLLASELWRFDPSSFAGRSLLKYLMAVCSPPFPPLLRWLRGRVDMWGKNNYPEET